MSGTSIIAQISMKPSLPDRVASASGSYPIPTQLPIVPHWSVITHRHRRKRTGNGPPFPWKITSYYSSMFP